MTDKLTIQVPIDDWAEEVKREEVELTSDADIIAAMATTGAHPLKLARMVIASREMGIAPEGIIAPNKTLLNVGGAEEVARLIRSQVNTVHVGDQSYEARAFVGPVDGAAPDGEEGAPDEVTFVAANTKLALARLATYISDMIPRHVWGRAVILASHAGGQETLHEALRALRAAIDGIEEKLTVPVAERA